ncbi:MAG: lytic transglycosylase domain-containing protein, partial [Candidatus Rokubacteria bacterium]|nr:lytic transglycosylase domain-containing protein [Candidatus Rokubacteria bacterium]
ARVPRRPELDGAMVEPAQAPPALTRRDIRTYIRAAALRHGVPPELVLAIVEAESSFDPYAVSPRGARGLMQLMPVTASSLDVDDAFDPYENIEAGVQHLRRLIDRFDGDLPLVLAAYNAGEGAVQFYGGVPPYRETRRYVARILRRLGREVRLDGRREVPSTRRTS